MNHGRNNRRRCHPHPGHRSRTAAPRNALTPPAPCPGLIIGAARLSSSTGTHLATRDLQTEVVAWASTPRAHGRPPHRIHPAGAPFRPGQVPPDAITHDRPTSPGRCPVAVRSICSRFSVRAMTDGQRVQRRCAFTPSQPPWLGAARRLHRTGAAETRRHSPELLALGSRRPVLRQRNVFRPRR
jgi:hypothetical protein